MYVVGLFDVVRRFIRTCVVTVQREAAGRGVHGVALLATLV